jgi:lipoyl(octanoyl) transferase
MNTVTYCNFMAPQPYQKMFQLQQQLHDLRVARQIEDHILLLEHTPVISIGRTPGAKAHLLADVNDLHQQDIEVCVTNRGGDITYHGPGQLVVYFILLLTIRDIGRFIRMLEQSIINLLAKYEIPAGRKSGYPGVWVGEEKICALGIYIRKWVTMHGIALNVTTNLAHFEYIVPCGIHEKEVTSMEKFYQERQIAHPFPMHQIKQEYLASFSEIFQVALHERDQKLFWASDMKSQHNHHI